MTDKAREARNAYKRKWYKENPEKRREYERRYWERVGQAASESAGKAREKRGEDNEFEP